MFESLRTLPPDEVGCSALELVFKAGLVTDPAFLAGAVAHLNHLKDADGQQLPTLEGLGSEVEASTGALILQHGESGRSVDLAFFAAALSAALVRRLGGEDARLEVDIQGMRAHLRLEPAGAFVHSFALLYSASFLHYFWREGKVESRLDQLLEVASLFFGNHAFPQDLGPLDALERIFPQETLNSFVNLIHPQPGHVGNQLTKILLLEDNRELGEIMADMLASCGYVVCQAPDGMVGLNRLERERFQLVLSDIQMPRLNGIGLLKAMRGRHVNVPVILTTGFTEIWQEDQALSQGAVAFLPKPFGMADLIRTVDRALGGPQTATPH